MGAAILCTGGPECDPKGSMAYFCRTSSGVRLCWELEEPKGSKGSEGIVGKRLEHLLPAEDAPASHLPRDSYHRGYDIIDDDTVLS